MGVSVPFFVAEFGFEVTCFSWVEGLSYVLRLAALQ